MNSEMFADQVHIRIAEQGLAFVYSVLRDGREIETGVIFAEEEEIAPGFYGGSEAMD